jgi:hypothetical protein
MVTPTVVPQGRPTVQAGTVPGSRSGRGSVVVTGVVVVVEPVGSEEVVPAANVDVVGATAASSDGADPSPRVIRNTANPSTKPAATIVIT